VLKVPHHGSRHSTSPAFLKATSPKIALVSAGYGNSFGLPAARTMTSLKELGIPTFRTDLDGTIQLVRKGKGFALSTFGDRLKQGHFH
jgi:competence protein ComEC